MPHVVLPARPEARRLLIGTLAASVGQGMTLPFLFIYLTDVRGLGATMVGLVVGWTGVVSLLLAGPGGSLIDRFGARRVVFPLYLAEAVGVASWGWVHTPAQAFGAATLTGLGGAVLWGAQNTIMTTVTDVRERQHVFGLAFAILNLGIGAGGVLAGFIADVHRASSFQLLYGVNAATNLIPPLILLTLPHVGGRIAAVEGAARDAATVEGRTPRAGGYREVFADRPFRRFVTFMLVLTACGYAQIEVGLPAFAADVAHVSTRVIAWGLAANTLTIVLAQLTVLRRLQGRSRSRALAAVGLLMGAAWLILGLGAWSRPMGAALPVLGVLACASVFALGETLLSPINPALTNALASDQLRGRYNAMGSMIWGVTAVIGPLTAAPLIGNGYGEIWVGLVVGGCLVSSALALSLRRMLSPQQDGRLADPVAAPAVLA